MFSSILSLFSSFIHFILGLNTPQNYPPPLSGEEERELFEIMVSFIKPPELLIYLKASVPTLVSHIRQRGLPYENAIGHEYLHMLNKKYDDWVGGYSGNILTIDIDNTDFVNNAGDRMKAINAIRSQLPEPLLSQVDAWKAGRK